MGFYGKGEMTEDLGLRSQKIPQKRSEDHPGNFVRISPAFLDLKFQSWAGLAQMLPTGKQAMVRPGDGGRMCESLSAV